MNLHLKGNPTLLLACYFNAQAVRAHDWERHLKVSHEGEANLAQNRTCVRARRHRSVEGHLIPARGPHDDGDRHIFLVGVQEKSRSKTNHLKPGQPLYRDVIETCAHDRCQAIWTYTRVFADDQVLQLSQLCLT